MLVSAVSCAHARRPLLPLRPHQGGGEAHERAVLLAVPSWTVRHS